MRVFRSPAAAISLAPKPNWSSSRQECRRFSSALQQDGGWGRQSPLQNQRSNSRPRFRRNNNSSNSMNDVAAQRRNRAAVSASIAKRIPGVEGVHGYHSEELNWAVFKPRISTGSAAGGTNKIDDSVSGMFGDKNGGWTRRNEGSRRTDHEPVAAGARVKRKAALVVGYVGTGSFGLSATSIPTNWDEERAAWARAQTSALRAACCSGAAVKTTPWKDASERDVSAADGASVVGPRAEELLQKVESAELPTLDFALRRALFQAGMISSRNIESLAKISWQRSSRTDKGVHAALATVAFKALVPHDTDWVSETGDALGSDLVSEINQFLPQHIRAFALLKVPRGWHPRLSCTSRTYSYLLPPEVFAGTSGWTLERVQELLQRFVGVHCFHNFGEKTDSAEQKGRRFGKLIKRLNDNREARRAIGKYEDLIDIDYAIDAMYGRGIQLERTKRELQSSLSSSEPLTPEEEMARFRGSTAGEDFFRREILSINTAPLSPSDGHPTDPWMSVTISGRSFMLHQIRLMMGMAIAVIQGRIPESFLDVALRGPFAVPVPKAPAEYLLLRGAEFARPCEREGLPEHVVPSDAKVIGLAEKFAEDVIFPHMFAEHFANASDHSTTMSTFLQEGMLRLADVDVEEMMRLHREVWIPAEQERAERRKAKADFWAALEEVESPLVAELDRLKGLLLDTADPFMREQLRERIDLVKSRRKALLDSHFEQGRRSQQMQVNAESIERFHTSTHKEEGWMF